ncbi:MAG: phosphorylase, partial [Polyangiaceae bacterium]|nr:phosphorylase [Polyangiaceae bacterium]
MLAVETGAAPASSWEERPAPDGREARVRRFTVEGGELRVAVVQAYGMGGVEAVIAASPWLDRHGVRCLAMCGVCAGRRGDVELGDVIIADRMWTYDTGKLKAEIVGGQRREQEKGDIEMYRIHPAGWKERAERFVHDPGAPWLALRPRTYEAQGDWVLERVLAGKDPIEDPDHQARCADFDKVLERLWKKNLL